MTIQDGDDIPAEPSSPACSMHEADDSYMGYAGSAELLAFLNSLLEAERAAACVTQQTAKAASGPLAALLRTIHQDEVRWCAMLARHVTMLGGAPPLTVGDFHDEAMAIDDIGERLASLNRGQGWIVRKLDEMLPRVRGDHLHAELSEMRRSHEANIALAAEFAGHAR